MSRRAAAVVLGSCSWSQSGKDGLLTAADSSALRHWSDGSELHVRTFRHQYRSVQQTVRTKMSNCPATRSELSRHMDRSFAHCGKSAKRRLRSPAGTRAEINFMRCAPHEINFWPCTVQRGSVVADVETDRFGRACLRTSSCKKRFVSRDASPRHSDHTPAAPYFSTTAALYSNGPVMAACII